MEHQLKATNYNGTPGCYSLPGGATFGNKHLHADTKASSDAAKAAVMTKQEKRAKALEGKHGTYLKLQKDIAERRKVEQDEMIKKAKGALKGQVVMTKFEEDSKEYREVTHPARSRRRTPRWIQGEGQRGRGGGIGGSLCLGHRGNKGARP